MPRERLTITGRVQGVGFRPFVYRMAQRFGVCGSVRNTSHGVLVEVQGPADVLAAFSRSLQAELPQLAHIVELKRNSLPEIPQETGFVIAESLAEGGSSSVLVSPDVATCDDCVRELFDPQNRRYLYPFINCTNCGPRYSLTRSLPYDRQATSMACFPLCDACANEYANPSDRRFHAQPDACPLCGPTAWFVPPENWAEASADEECRTKGPSKLDQLHTTLTFARRHGLTNLAALSGAAVALSRGSRVAVKGLGGFHLVCDASDEAVVASLRQAKQRPHKPLAVMAADLHAARQLAEIGPKEEALLISRERPIVLCRLLKEQATSFVMLAANIAPDTPYVGIMLPYTPLHHVLLWLYALLRKRLRDGVWASCQSMRDVAEALAAEAASGCNDLRVPLPAAPLVMTSGNRTGEPLCLGNREALKRLEGIAHCFLLHDRDILVRVDDSVVRPMPEPLRASSVVPALIDNFSNNFSSGACGDLCPETVSVSEAQHESFGNRHALMLELQAKPEVPALEHASPPDRSLMLRRARGFVPLPLPMPADSSRPIIAFGSELKNTICLTRRDEAFVSQHLGDADNFETFLFQADTARHLRRLLGVTPELAVCDAHPNFSSHAQTAALAEEFPQACARLYRLQHHMAHGEAVLAEHGVREPALVLALDGTGYAENSLGGGELWGGELLYIDPSRFTEPGDLTGARSSATHRRLGTLQGVTLPGGEKAIREPWRMAWAFLQQQSAILGETPERPEDILCLLTDDAEKSYHMIQQAQLVTRMVERNVNCPVSHSAGRLFDLVSSLLGLCGSVTYEGQAAIRLESAQSGDICDAAALRKDLHIWNAWLGSLKRRNTSALPLLTVLHEPGTGFLTLEHAPFISALWRLRCHGAPVSVLSRFFHVFFAEGLAELALAGSLVSGATLVGLSGGVLQNMTLAMLLEDSLTRHGLTPLFHRSLPPNDGCIAYGQAAWLSRLRA